ncbi:hypothetical protein SBRCBS47491_005348 [Sporothrix bragantina]|uniref:C2H2-type domain-containing protein n=1 Tax=Sporothrix bragantina TaxID=671064 RepID=A0ABP0BXS9_9PEZI
MASRAENSQETQRNDESRFPCNQCSRTFKRLEHLSRHRQSHQDIKRFECPVCFKRFARSDILLRHRLIHLATPASEPQDSTGPEGSGHQAAPQLTGRGSRRKRACLACAKAHESCSKGDPCQRCLARSTQCIYAVSKSARRSQGELDTPVETQPLTSQVQDLVQDVPEDEALVQEPESINLLGDGDQQPFEDNAAQAVSLLLGMHGTQQLMPSQNYVPEGTDMSFLALQRTDTVPDPTTQVDETPVYNTWNPQGMPTDGPAFNFPINWLPENLHTDLDYVSILGPILGQSLLPSNLDPPPAAFQQMQINTPVPVETGSLLQATTLSSNAIPLIVHNGGDGPGNSSVTSPVTSSVTSSEHTPTSATSRLRSARPSSTPGRGHLYTTSMNGARVPCTVRDKTDYVPIPGTKQLSPIKLRGAVPPVSAAPSGVSISRLPNLNHISLAHLLPADDGAVNFCIWPSTYEKIRQGIQQVYIASGEAQLSDDNAIPSLEHLNYFVHLFFEKCNPILPILHENVNTLNDFWLLALAVATVGSQYTFTEEFTGLSGALHEILHRALLIAQEDAHNNNYAGNSNLALTQSLLLSQIGLLYHGPPRLFRRAKANHGVLVDLLRCGMLLEPSTVQQQTREGVISDIASLEQEWRQWVHDESRRRLGYAIWLLDCMMVFQMGHRAFLSLYDAQASLPHDGLWAAPTAEKWHIVMKQSQANPNLPTATQQLFVEKRIKPDLGEFSRIVLLHGVYQEIWQVKRYFDRPLSNWVLSGPAAPDDRPLLSQSVNSTDGPASSSSYSKWRNAACDCVDVLHWGANGMIAQLSGSEHTTVFHLHFSRVVLLTPFDEIQTLARYLASIGGYQSDAGLGPLPTRSQGLAAERAIIEWAQQDEHKARLAVLHCGCFFWHIRRYSAMAFYEPIAVFMATLSIWAYSSYASQATSTNRQLHIPGTENENESRSGTASPTRASSRIARETFAGGHNNDDNDDDDDSDERVPSFIRLDRPNDDEMVQLFVRMGRPSVMRAYISGIGDICSPKAPVRILKEGGKILANVSMVWGRTDRYMNVLTSMTAALVKLAEEW